mgnify:FL=1
MGRQNCNQLCYGVHTESCANKQLYQIATGGDRSPSTRPTPATSVTLVVAALVLFLAPAAAARI